MFERFTERARRIVDLALDEARGFGHNYICTEHLLLGLIREREGVGARALVDLGVDEDESRERVESIVGYGEEGTPTRAPLTPRCRKVLHLAEREALQLGDDYVSSEHILLGLVREGEGVAARVLSDLDINPGEVRREVAQRITDREPGVDPFDEEEWIVEEHESRMLFQGQVTGVRAELNLPRPLSVSIGADYSYRASVGTRDSSRTVEPASVAGVLQDESAEMEARGIDAAVATLGDRLLDAFPAMLEVTVPISGLPEPADALTFSVSATFER